MSVALIKWVLTRLLPGVLLCTLLAGGGWLLRHGGYQAGFTAAKSAGDVALASEKKARADERQRTSEATTAALIKAQQDEQAQRARADVLAATLADKTGQLAQARLLYARALGYGDGHTGTGH